MGPKLALLLAMVILPAIVGVVEAADFRVGYDPGWILGTNYTTWAQDLEFKVGDRLVFLYNPNIHDVVKVGGSEFNSCNILANAQPLTSGNDTITLTTPGRKWYICSRGNHCQLGMKLFINVIAETEAPAPSPTGGEGNSANIVAYPYLMAALLASLAMMIMH